MTTSGRIFQPGGTVKICGLREPEHAAVAAKAGADLLGFIFAQTRRQVTAELAARAIGAARTAAGSSFLSVGIFVNAAPETVNAVADRAGLDLVQLHGDISAASLSRYERPVIIALRPTSNDPLDTVRATIERWIAGPMPPAGFVVDGYHPTEHGGQGVRADWAIAAALAMEQPLLLAGGLVHANVAEAIRAVNPAGVDVSSGVETDGVKDPEKIRRFVSEARAAFSARVEARV